MNPFSFLSDIGSSISNWLSPHADQNGFNAPGFKNDALYNLQNNLVAPVPYDSNGNLMAAQNVVPQALPPSQHILKQKPQPPQQIPQQGIPSPDVFARGFNNFALNTPVASQAGLFSQAAGQLAPGIDKLLPAIMSIIETGGGRHMVANNNPFNIAGTQGGQNGFIDYPDLSTALLGGPNGGAMSGGLVGQLNGPIYSDYRQSGNLEDFFKHYTPPGEAYGNPSMQQLIERYNLIRSLFGQ